MDRRNFSKMRAEYKNRITYFRSVTGIIWHESTEFQELDYLYD